MYTTCSTRVQAPNFNHVGSRHPDDLAILNPDKGGMGNDDMSTLEHLGDIENQKIHKKKEEYGDSFM